VYSGLVKARNKRVEDHSLLHRSGQAQKGDCESYEQAVQEDDDLIDIVCKMFWLEIRKSFNASGKKYPQVAIREGFRLVAFAQDGVVVNGTDESLTQTPVLFVENMKYPFDCNVRTSSFT
jgi:hypothetical protein